MVRTTNGRTGLAVVIVDAAGENAIVVDPGANAELVGLGEAERAAVTAAHVLLMQLEVPLPTVTEAAQMARAAGTTVVLNAAPHAALDGRLCDSIDLLLVNEGEARALAADTSSGGGSGDGRGGTADTMDRDLDRLLERVPAVLVTLGSRGALYRDRAGARHHEPGRPVTVVDTTAAGDSFAGYLAAALADGLPVPVAVARANAAAALSVGRRWRGAGRAAPARRRRPRRRLTAPCDRSRLVSRDPLAPAGLVRPQGGREHAVRGEGLVRGRRAEPVTQQTGALGQERGPHLQQRVGEAELEDGRR